MQYDFKILTYTNLQSLVLSGNLHKGKKDDYDHLSAVTLMTSLVLFLKDKCSDKTALSDVSSGQSAQTNILSTCE